MKELSRQSLQNIHYVINGQNYVNIKARLNQWLPPEYAQAFSYIKIVGSNAVWYGEDEVDYQPFSAASASEKEEIAACLEDCREVVCHTLEANMPYVNNLFVIPSQDQILWYRNANDEVRVTLTQWGFEGKTFGAKTDIIGMLIQAPRVLKQQDVTIHIDYSDGTAAAATPFFLQSFNHEKRVETNEQGDFHLGKIFANKTFAVDSIDRKNHYEFTVSPQATYRAVFDYFVEYTVAIENQAGEKKADFSFKIDQQVVKTDETGVVGDRVKLTSDKNSIVVEVDGDIHSFTLQHEPEQNHFVVKVQDKPSSQPVPPTPPPTPRKELVSITLLDFDGQPLPNLPFRIKTKKNRVVAEAQTDANGKASIDKELFAAKDKYIIDFVVSDEYRKQLNNIKKSHGN